MADETKNVKISFENRVNVQLAGQNIHWQGADFDPGAVTHWIEPRVLGCIPAPSRLATRDERWQFNVNVYAKTGPGGQTTHKVWELADLLVTAFDQITFPLQNWAGIGDPTIGYIRCSEVEVIPIPAQGGREPTELQQLTCSFSGLVLF